ncbi:MAG: hypothetical protein RRA92_02565 [Gemmatimonadota bacterium]|nr:hypothetical protein [Gemmatimonadota bacterium]
MTSLPLPDLRTRRGRRASRAAFAALAVLAGLTGPPSPAEAQSPSEAQTHGRDWNDPRTLALVRAAIDARRHPWGDSTLEAFDLYAEGRVHYLADFGGEAGQQALRADRIALELRWRRDVGSLQEIVGRRYSEWLPTRIHYHIDHLALVVDNYGDRIRIGEGDEVRDAPHPLAPRAPEIYDYRFVDSLAMQISGVWRTLARLEVRPKRPGEPAVLGTLDLDRRSHGLTRLAVTFTPASYVDPRLVHVSLELENALVEGRTWLPSAQRTEIRRRLAWMELPFGSSIRTSFRVLEYDMAPALRGGVPPGHHVRARPRRDLARYAGWRTPALKAWPEDVRTDSVRLEEVRDAALSIAGRRIMEGGAGTRLYVPGVSSALRVRRAEGVFAGAGVRHRLDGRHELTGLAGWVFGREEGFVRLAASRRAGDATLTASGYVNDLADAGPFPAAAGLVASLGALADGDDWTDPYFRTGASLSLAGPLGRLGTGEAALAVERHDGAALELDPLGGVDARPVRPIDEGTDLLLSLRLERYAGTLAGTRLTATLAADLSAGSDFGYTRWTGELRALPREPDAAWAWEARAGLGAGTGTLPAQKLILLGGRGTLPGYRVRAFGGDAGGFLHVAVSRSVWHPWVRVRALGAAGWADAGGPGRDAAARFGVGRTGDLRTSLGGGVALFYDVVRVDGARGLRDGRWEWMVSVSPAFRAPL